MAGGRGEVLRKNTLPGRGLNNINLRQIDEVLMKALAAGSKRGFQVFQVVAHKAQFLEYYATVGFLLPRESLCFELRNPLRRAWNCLRKRWSGATSLLRIFNFSSGESLNICE